MIGKGFQGVTGTVMMLLDSSSRFSSLSDGSKTACDIRLKDRIPILPYEKIVFDVGHESTVAVDGVDHHDCFILLYFGILGIFHRH